MSTHVNHQQDARHTSQRLTPSHVSVSIGSLPRVVQGPVVSQLVEKGGQASGPLVGKDGPRASHVTVSQERLTRRLDVGVTREDHHDVLVRGCRSEKAGDRRLDQVFQGSGAGVARNLRRDAHVKNPVGDPGTRSSLQRQLPKGAGGRLGRKVIRFGAGSQPKDPSCQLRGSHDRGRSPVRHPHDQDLARPFLGSELPLVLTPRSKSLVPIDFVVWKDFGLGRQPERRRTR
jgi:hypothetical protein